MVSSFPVVAFLVLLLILFQSLPGNSKMVRLIKYGEEVLQPIGFQSLPGNSKMVSQT